MQRALPLPPAQVFRVEPTMVCESSIGTGRNAHFADTHAQEEDVVPLRISSREEGPVAGPLVIAPVEDPERGGDEGSVGGGALGAVTASQTTGQEPPITAEDSARAAKGGGDAS